MKVLDDYDKQKLFNFIKTKELFKNFDYSTIGELCTFNVDGNGKNIRGRVEILSTEPLKFRIMLQNDILNTFSISTSSQATVFHEFCHCLEIATTLKHYNFYTLHNRPQDNTWQLLFSTAIECWGEYFACFHSCKLRKETRVLTPKIKNLYLYKQLFSKNFNHDDSIKYVEELWDGIVNMIRTTVILAACYHSTGDIQYANELHLQNTHPKYNILDDYIKNIVQYFHQLYETYPQWVSKDKFIEIGYTLFSLIKYLDLNFSTNDLSDSFMLKYCPKQ